MAKASPFKVLIRDLPPGVQLERRFEVLPAQVADWVKGLPMRDALGAPEGDPQAGEGGTELNMYADGAHVFASGTFRGHVVVACSRCLEPMKLEIDDPLHVTFMPRHELPADDGEESEAADADDEGAQVNEEDLDLFPYEGDVIDLEPLFREQFVLAIPFSPLCREDCKGLCPQCGIDRNSATCTCEKPIDPRLAALKGLKLPS
ncbi:MAG: DUF177 domain-containing protein [Kofleriaceae bacterium]